MTRHQGSRRLFFLICAGVLIFLSLSAGSSMNIFVWNIAFIQSRPEKEGTIHYAEDQDWRQTSLFEILDVWRPKTLKSCQNVCENKEYERPMCLARTYEEYETLQNTKKLNLLPLFSPKEYIFPYEKEYLSYPPLTDSRKLPSLNLSKVVLSHAVNDEVTCQVNDVVQGLVQLVDEYGHERKLGGDEIRVWVVNRNQTSLNATGQVTDLRNGSYQISFKCLWPGEMELNIAVPYPREYLRATMSQTNLGVTRLVTGRFKKGKFQEVTICWSTPNIPDRPCLCNLTDFNQQSLYCGRPLHPKLDCTHFRATSNLPMPVPQRVTEAEQELIKNVPGPARKFLIRHNFKVVVEAEGALPSPPPCYQTNPNITWKISPRPRGYWSPQGWTSLDCQRPIMTRNWVTDCLKNTRVWIFGDSNALRFYRVLTNETGSGDRGLFHSRAIDKNAKANITITFTPLELPLYTSNQWKQKNTYGGVAQNIDRIPSTGQHVVIIHYYLHFTPAHLSALQDRLQNVHGAVKRLLARNPDVLVGIRGPHIATNMWDINHAVGTDSLGTFFIDMLVDIFQDLQHKVVFLDGWGMTIALENVDGHPSEEVPREMMRTLLSFKCK